MGRKKIVFILVFLIIVISAVVSWTGISSNDGQGTYQYETIRGEKVTIYGKGLYKHMSAEVAIQGIAQDYVTLFIAIPLLIISLILYYKGSMRGRLLLTGVLSYFFITYLFYLAMAMYNEFFLLYAFLMGVSFFSITIMFMSFDIIKLSCLFCNNTPVKFVGGFLIFNAFAIAMLWLSIVVPPLLNGSIYPKELEHYTTLIVQGMDLGLLLPLATVSGALLFMKKPLGYLIGSVYSIFLMILMIALTGKVIAMGMAGYNIIPVIFIIPSFGIISIICNILLLKNVGSNE